MKVFKVASVLVFSILVAQSASARNTKLNSCDNVSTSQQVFECSKEQRSAADLKLNEEYKSLQDRIRSQYRANTALMNELLTNVKNAQIAWISFRDKNCALYAFEIEPSKPAYKTTINNCFAKMSVDRGTELKSLFP